jgi:inner membrane protein
MDNLCHTLAGAVLGEAGLKTRTALANPVLMIASNLPDVDALVFATDTPLVAFRRGWTHGVPAQLLLPLLLTGAVVLFDRVRSRSTSAGTSRVRTAAVLLLSYVGVLSHVGLDILNNYGVRLLMPFSNRWFYGDAVFIVDPWLWLTLGAGVWLARRRGRVSPARLALSVAIVYIALMIWSARAARSEVESAWTAAHGAPPRSLMVGPAPVNPFRKSIIADAGPHYETGTFEWWPRRMRFDRERVLKREDEAPARRAREHAAVQAVLRWARFPYYQIAPASGGARVTLQDLRFGRRVGSVTVFVSAYQTVND